jgi:hypothetical protein
MKSILFAALATTALTTGAFAAPSTLAIYDLPPALPPHARIATASDLPPALPPHARQFR